MSTIHVICFRLWRCVYMGCILDVATVAQATPPFSRKAACARVPDSPKFVQPGCNALLRSCLTELLCEPCAIGNGAQIYSDTHTQRCLYVRVLRQHAHTHSTAKMVTAPCMCRAMWIRSTQATNRTTDTRAAEHGRGERQSTRESGRRARWRESETRDRARVRGNSFRIHLLWCKAHVASAYRPNDRVPVSFQQTSQHENRTKCRLARCALLEQKLHVVKKSNLDTI